MRCSLGGANARDLGFHFPDTDQSYKGIDSKILLSKTMEIVRAKGFELGNIDATVCLQRPKIKDHIPLMKAKIAEVLGVSENKVSVKATTTEQLGFVGREEGVSAYAVVLI